MRSPSRGEIWLAYTPGQPHDPHQPRYVLVISTDARNRAADDFLVVPVFSRGRLGPTRVAVPPGSSGLQWESVLYCEEITTIHADFLEDGPRGRVNQSILEEVVVAVRRAIGDFS